MDGNPGNFIWQWQRQFQQEIATVANNFFSRIDLRLDLEVYLVGLLDQKKKDVVPVPEPILVEPSDGSFSIADLKGVEELALTFRAVDAGGRVEMSDYYGHLKHIESIEAQSYISAIKKKLEFKDPAGRYEYSLSMPCLVENYRVFVILKMPRKVVYSHHLLRKQSLGPLLPVSRSFLESAITTFLEECSVALLDTSKSVGFIRTTYDELLRKAGRRFVSGVGHRIKSLFAFYELYSSCDKISSLKYEGVEGLGRMILADDDHRNVRLTFKLADPIPLSDHRKVRKFLEIADRETQIVCNGEKILGLGNTTGIYNPTDESLSSSIS